MKRRIMIGVVVAMTALSLPAGGDLHVGPIDRVSLGLDGEEFAGGVGFVAMSDDGSRVVFMAGDIVYLRDVGAGSTVVVSRLPGGSMAIAPVPIWLSVDGGRVLFAVEGAAGWRLYVRDVGLGTTVELRADVPLSSSDPLPFDRLPEHHFFPSGWVYGFSSFGDLETVEVRRHVIAQPGGVPGTALTFTGIGEVYRCAVATGERTYAGEYMWYSAPNRPTGAVEFFGTPFLGTRSADGRWSLFFSTEAETPEDLDPPPSWDGPSRWDYFLHDFSTGATRLITKTDPLVEWEPWWPGFGDDPRPFVSDDGSRVVLHDADGLPYRWDAGGLAELAGLPAGATVQSGDGRLDRLAVLADRSAYLWSPDGRELVTLTPFAVDQVWMSTDGSVAVVGSDEPLVPGDANDAFDLFRIPIVSLPFDDISSSMFIDEIIWLSEQAITRGCNPAGSLFCPDDPVTRGQMAAFLNRALDLPVPPEGDPFVDDGGMFEADIEALAAAGVTRGCDPTGSLFCPDDPVTRGQMAAFLWRALGG